MSDSMDQSRATRYHDGTRSEETLKTGDEISADISERLNQFYLDGASTMGDSTPALAHQGNQNETRAVANEHSGSRVESSISNSQFTSGRDTISYHVSGNFTINNYEGTAAERDQKAAEISRNYIDDEDDIAAGMLVPAPPPCLLERDAQHNQIVAKLVATDDARVAILGMGGIGKTSLACSVANDPQVEETYPRRLFLSFEGCSTPDLAYATLASAFQIPVDRRSSHRQVLSQILNYLKREKTLFIIDNLETFWEVPSNRRAADELLAQLAALQNLAMVVTLRGHQRPGNIRWLRTQPLKTLTLDASQDLLSSITEEEYTGANSEHVQWLLDAVSGIPLAITLIGTLLRDNSETPESLWRRWTRESTQAIGIANDADPDDRLYKLDVSLRLSIFGPRMSDHAKEVLAGIAILPTGLNMDEEWLDRFQATLPSTINIRSCINTLRNVALIPLESSISALRLRLLPPVRDFCLKNMPIDGILAYRLIDIYKSDLQKHWDIGSSEHYTWVMTELRNFTAIFDRVITLRYVTYNLGDATFRYAEWMRFLCIPEENTIERVIDILSDHPESKAECLQALGSTFTSSHREAEAIPILEDALSIHRELGDHYQVAWDLYILGYAHRLLHNYTDAEQCLDEARELSSDTDNWQKGSVLQALANVYFEMDRVSEAENTAKEALELCRASGNRKEESNGLNILGRVYTKQGNYDLAIEKLAACCEISQATHDTDGEAVANENLGYVYRNMEKPSQAALHFRTAVSLFEQTRRARNAEGIRATLRELELEMSLRTSNS